MPDPAPAPENPNAAAVEKVPVQTNINGGKQITITHFDGTEETVTVRLVPLTLASKYFEHVSEIVDFVALAVDKTAVDVAKWTDDTIFAVDKLARELNDPRFDRWLKRQEEAVLQNVLTKKVTDLTKYLPKP